MRAAAAIAVLLLAAGCGGGDEAPESAATFTGAPLELQDPGAVHVHGLGYDTAAGVLYIATHTGLFELPDGDSEPTRIGDSHQDTMGFALVEPGHFLGSGHPDARENLPPHLGLIRSTDDGRTWQPVSLGGEADFHVLRARGKHVFGFDVTGERLLASSDAGRTWTPLQAPENLLDLAVDPADPDHLLGAGGAVLYETTNRGRSWRATATGATGYLAWPAPRRLYLATPDGAFLAATGAAGPWRSRTALGAPVAALHAAGAELLFAALHDGTIKRSDDGGRTWTVRTSP